MLLSVFAGLRMFGFWGIVLGPVLMIIIVTTISVYLAVYKGAPLETVNQDDEAELPSTQKVAVALAATKPTAVTDEDRRRRLPRQPSREEFDDRLRASYAGWPSVPGPVGQHRMRHPAESVFVTRRRIDLDHLERVAEPLPQGGESLAGYGLVTGEAQTDRAQPVLLGPVDHDLHLGLRHPGIAPLAGVNGNGTDGWLSTGASTLSSTAAANAKPPVKHMPITPTPGPGVGRSGRGPTRADTPRPAAPCWWRRPRTPWRYSPADRRHV